MEDEKKLKLKDNAKRLLRLLICTNTVKGEKL